MWSLFPIPHSSLCSPFPVSRVPFPVFCFQFQSLSVLRFPFPLLRFPFSVPVALSSSFLVSRSSFPVPRSTFSVFSSSRSQFFVSCSPFFLFPFFDFCLLFPIFRLLFVTFFCQCYCFSSFFTGETVDESWIVRNVAEEFWMTLIFLQHARVLYFHLLHDVKKYFPWRKQIVIMVNDHQQFHCEKNDM